MKLTRPIVALGKIIKGVPIVNNRPWFLSQFQDIEDCNIKWIVEKERRARSRKLENFLWGVAYPLASAYTGHRDYELHEIFCTKFLKSTKKWRGAEMKTIASTKNLGQDEYSLFFDQVIQELAEINVIVPNPDKYYKEREEFGDEAVSEYVHRK